MGRAASQVRVMGPLLPFAAGFREELARRGYTPLSADNQVRLLAHASRWLAARGLGAAEFTPERAGAFLRSRRGAGYAGWCSERGLAPLLGYLRVLGVVPLASGPALVTDVDVLAGRYCAYLAAERGLVASTVGYYAAEALGRSAFSGQLN